MNCTVRGGFFGVGLETGSATGFGRPGCNCPVVAPGTSPCRSDAIFLPKMRGHEAQIAGSVGIMMTGFQSVYGRWVGSVLVSFGLFRSALVSIGPRKKKFVGTNVHTFKSVARLDFRMIRVETWAILRWPIFLLSATNFSECAEVSLPFLIDNRRSDFGQFTEIQPGAFAFELLSDE